MPKYMTEKGPRVLANGYNIVPIRPGTKAPDFEGWRKIDKTTETHVKQWNSNGRAGYGIGITTKWTPFLDIDVQDRDCISHIVKQYRARFGRNLALRVGAAPKCGFVFRTDEPFKKVSSKEYRDPQGKKAQVEFLGDGQQFVAFAIHPDTHKPYRWGAFDSPDITPANELPVVNEADARACIEIFTAYAEQRGWPRWQDKTAGNKTAAPDWNDIGSTSNEPVGLSEDELRALVDRIPNDDAPYQGEGVTWLNVMAAIHHETGGSDFGKDLALGWSDKSSKHENAKFEKTWNSLGKEDRDDPVTARLLILAAKEFDKRPTIFVQAGELPRVVAEAEAALIAGGAPIYSRAHQLVRPVVETVDAAYGQKTRTARLVELTEAGLTDYFSQHARWEKFDMRRNERIACDPPAKAAQILLSRDGNWNVPPLAGVITTPTIRQDGSLLIEPGYDPQTRLVLMQPPRMPEIAARPTRKQAEQALALLLELLPDFPFINDASLAVALSTLMTPVARGALPVAPLHLARAPMPGSGKSHLMSTASVIATGEICPVISASRIGEETEKRLAACMVAGQSIISLDNLNGELEGDFLCQAVEQQRPQVRILGKTERRTIESRTTIFATGNNLIVRGDMVRRTIVCSLDPNLERPELRQFHGDPVERVLQDRGRYIAAILTIIRAYMAAGEPGLLRPLASFEHWSRYVRSPLVWLGCADPVDTIELSRQEDPTLNIFRQFVNAWRRHIGTGAENGKTATEILAITRDPTESETDMTEFAEILATVAGDAHRFGNWLRRNRDRIVDGLKLVGRENRKRKIIVWSVEDMNPL